MTGVGDRQAAKRGKNNTSVCFPCQALLVKDGGAALFGSEPKPRSFADLELSLDMKFDMPPVRISLQNGMLPSL
jgi:hypothetical protein